jgi:hypothetical protein
MVTHIVFWNLKDELIGEERQQAADNIKEVLESLPCQIEGLIKAEVGINFNPQGSDICLYSQLESEEALGLYQNHPAHLKVKHLVQSLVKQRWVVDYRNH